MITRITSALLCGLLFIGLSAMAADKEAKANTVTLQCVKGGCNDTGQCCGFCEGGLTKALKSVEGVAKVSTDKKAKTITVTPKAKAGKLDLAALQAAAKKSGFEVKEAKLQ